MGITNPMFCLSREFQMRVGNHDRIADRSQGINYERMARDKNLKIFNLKLIVNGG